MSESWRILLDYIVDTMKSAMEDEFEKRARQQIEEETAATAEEERNESWNNDYY